MSKEFFRFLRGELNGFYITSLNKSLILSTEYIKNNLAHLRKLVFKSAYTPLDREDAVKQGELPMSLSQLLGIGKFAGIFLPYVEQDADTQAIRFPDPPSAYRKNIDGKWQWFYGERGLFNTEIENFKFIRTNDSIYDKDINTEASKTERTSMVEDGAVPLGYIEEGAKVYDENTGEIIPGVIKPTPPVGKAYSIWYGEKYLSFGEYLLITAQITEKAYYELIKLVQIIKYNGVSISTLAEMGRIFCTDDKGNPYVHIVSIDWTSHYAYGIVKYKVDYGAPATKKLMYLNLLLATAKLMFPQLAYEEDTSIQKKTKEAK